MIKLISLALVVCTLSSTAQALESEKCPGDTGYYFTNYKHRNPTLGGFVSYGADVTEEAGVFVAKTAAICKSASVSENARIYGNAIITDSAEISGNARIFGNAIISDDSVVTDSARVYENAKISGSSYISGNARIKGWSKIISQDISNGIIDKPRYTEEEKKRQKELERQRAERKRQQEERERNSRRTRAQKINEAYTKLHQHIKNEWILGSLAQDDKYYLLTHNRTKCNITLKRYNYLKTKYTSGGHKSYDLSVPNIHRFYKGARPYQLSEIVDVNYKKVLIIQSKGTMYDLRNMPYVQDDFEVPFVEIITGGSIESTARSPHTNEITHYIHSGGSERIRLSFTSGEARNVFYQLFNSLYKACSN